MATIAENLQIIKDSTEAIKQAIIDKGGSVDGDISTWASVISGLSCGGGSPSDGEITFTGTCSYTISTVTIAGYLNKVPDTGRNHLLALGWSTGGLCSDSYNIDNIGPYTLTVDFDEPIFDYTIPAICILNIVEREDVMDYDYNIIPVKFEKEIGTDQA